MMKNPKDAIVAVQPMSYDPKLRVYTINGVKAVATDVDGEIKYEEVVRRAGLTGSPTCTFETPSGVAGTLLREQGVYLIPGVTRFTCVHTGNA